MSTKKSTSVLCICLILALPHHLCAQVAGKRGSKDHPIERLYAVAPDLKYATIQTGYYKGNDWSRVQIFENLGWRLVEVIDIKSESYKTLCELPSNYESITFCDLATLAMCRNSYPDNLYGTSELTIFEFLKADSPTVVFMSNPNDTSTQWFISVGCSEFDYRDSLLVYAQVVEVVENTGQYGVEVVARRFSADGECPVTKTIPDAREPRFSHDGNQILASRCVPGAGGCSLHVYDIALDTVLTYTPFKWVRAAQRVSENSPIYYLSSQLDWSGYNIRCFDPRTGTDTALTYTLGMVSRFFLTADSLVYEVSRSREGKIETGFKTIRLK